MDLELRTSVACPEHKSSDSAFLAFVSHGILDRVCGTRHRNEKPTRYLMMPSSRFSTTTIAPTEGKYPRSSPRPAEVVSSDGVQPSGKYVSCRLRATLWFTCSEKEPTAHFCATVPNRCLWKEYSEGGKKKLVSSLNRDIIHLQ